MKDTLHAVLLGLALIVLGAVIPELCTSCTPAERQIVDSAIVVATYERELDHCREQGRASHSYEVYEACARSVDRRLCVERGVRCVEDGGTQ